ncbi:hypothetical protein P4637_10205 [Halalkalibacterium halodurans]|jgi:hypothetical protein|uniref:Lipoprotein n=1 Tax=Halalkalibacterium halodurans TaxID=86665 RepID=A0A0M0KIB3_ALKHA|nr:hypothetical protein [Halalkalibacterium halodurans]MDY7223425.1 hypothetical protein [Halalkalibacterium halodurans]MDY7242646.1 hypothetical protein [Halalkalibacterium halodurans]MED3647337.1 hypothetical protein [Halalkalibacterium halodurans]MED4081647.1 hypothetical protein [Halalkalibacterium halodurans]MED4085200.1 hypothetical protein [Halalkalibacterium halodurans]
MIRFVLAFIGLCAGLYGCISLLAYLSLLTTGYSFTHYVLFIVFRFELYLMILGFSLFVAALLFPDIRRRKRRGRY